MSKQVVVIGGGASGLAAAFKLRRAADTEGVPVEFTLVEKDPRLGGKIRTEHADGFTVDGGPDCFLTEKPAAWRLARLTGIQDETLPTDDSRKKTWILARGRKHEMPDGVMMFAPTKFWPFATTGLFTWPGKIRMGMDVLIPKKKQLGDETLASFVKRRMGQECLDYLAEPLVGGVHASDPEQMSLAATFPRLLDMEQKFGSMIGGFVDARRKVAAMRKKYPPKPGDRPRTFFTSFKGGMQQLTDAVADAAGRDRMLTGVAVKAISRDGEGWQVVLEDGRALDADAVIVATEGWAAAELLSSVDAEVGRALAEIPHSGSVTVSFAFPDESAVGFNTDAFGLLVPLVEKRALMACTLSSTKWPGRAPKGAFLLRTFLGGPLNQAIMAKSDDELAEIALSEARDILGLEGEPLFSKVFRWERGMPQYTVGHLDRVALVFDRLAATKGLAVAGGAYRGVGVPNCIESAEEAVTKVLGDLGITLAEDSAPKEGRRY